MFKPKSLIELNEILDDIRHGVVWFQGANLRAKRSLLRALAGVPREYELPEIESRACDEYPFLSPSFGVIPNATLNHNIKYRGAKFGLFGKSNDAYYCQIVKNNFFSSDSLTTECSQLAPDEIILFHIKTLEHLRVKIFFVESWMQSPSEDLKPKINELFYKIAERAWLTYSCLENRWLMEKVASATIDIDDLFD